MQLSDIMQTKMGQILISLLLGFGLATLFRKVCKENCVMIKGPPSADLNKYFYKIDDNCYKYTSYATDCSTANA